jgi:hypothetical protein
MASKVKLRDMVETVLKDNEETRNSDIKLTIAIWIKYYPDYVLDTSQGDKSGIFLDALFILPREDNVKRIRAKIQNEEKKYLPTDPEVRRKRKISEEEWYDYLGYARTNPNQTELGGEIPSAPKAVSWLND